MSALADVLSWVFLAAGGAFCVIGASGLIRMPDFYTRAHAASVIETLGAGLVLLGLLIFFASPTATHALTRAALLRGVKPFLADEGEISSKP